MGPEKEPDLHEVLRRLSVSKADEEAWQRLYEGIRPLVLAITFRGLKGALFLAEDASQEVFVRLVRYCKFDEFREPEHFRAYVATIASNVVRDYLKRQMRSTEAILAGHGFRSDPESPNSVEEIALAGLRVEEFLKQLSESDRRIADLLMKGHTLVEIARKTGLSYPNIAIRAFRLRRKLRKYLIGKDL